MFNIGKANEPTTDEHGLLNGLGRWVNRKGVIYDGEWRDGIPHGKMTISFPDGSRYEGEHEAGCRHGKGVLILPNGTRQSGWFEKDVYIGAEKKHDHNEA